MLISRDGEKIFDKMNIYLCPNSQNINEKEYLQSNKGHG